MNEFERIEAIRRILRTDQSQVQLGIGDDAAVLAQPQGSLVVSVDAAVEGVHFRREFGPWRILGRRACVAALSDLAAMGAEPLAMVANLQLPDNFADDDLLELVQGQADAASEFRAPLVGGNLCGGGQLAITTTVLGTVRGPALGRTGARPGDRLYCVGPLGAAALGLQSLLQGTHNPLAEPFEQAFLRPTAYLNFGQGLHRSATAAIDVSDGLVQDLGHLCDASKVSAHLDEARLPTLPGQAHCARALGLDPSALQLRGGEDYALLFTAPADLRVANPAVQIGSIVEIVDVPEIYGSGGRSLRSISAGFVHFGQQ